MTLEADKAYVAAAFVADLRSRRITPHIAPNDHLTKTGKRRRTTIDGRTTRHAGFATSQRVRKRIEEAFGWVKTAAGKTSAGHSIMLRMTWPLARFAKTRFRGTGGVDAAFTLATVAYNLIRLPRLLAEAPPPDTPFSFAERSLRQAPPT